MFATTSSGRCRRARPSSVAAAATAAAAVLPRAALALTLLLLAAPSSGAVLADNTTKEALRNETTTPATNGTERPATGRLVERVRGGSPVERLRQPPSKGAILYINRPSQLCHPLLFPGVCLFEWCTCFLRSPNRL